MRRRLPISNILNPSNFPFVIFPNGNSGANINDSREAHLLHERCPVWCACRCLKVKRVQTAGEVVEGRAGPRECAGGGFLEWAAVLVSRLSEWSRVSWIANKDDGGEAHAAHDADDGGTLV